MVVPTPTVDTLIISSSIFNNDLPDISEVSFKNTIVVDIPTLVDSPTDIIVVIPTGLWITLSIVIKDLTVASSDGTERLLVFAIPTTLVNDTAAPIDAKVAEIATLILSASSLITKTVGGNNVVAATPALVSDVFAIPIDDWAVCGLYTNSSPVLKFCFGIFTICV